MQSRDSRVLSEKQRQNSDDEGFFAQKIEIKKTPIHQHNRSSSMQTRAHFYKSPFEAKFLQWTGTMKKQPIEVLITPNQFPDSIHEKIQKRRNKQNKNFVQDHPYKLYATNPEYQLVYCRTKGEPIINDKYFMSNEVHLHHVGTRSNNCCKRLKDYVPNQSNELKPSSLAFDSRFQSGNLHCVYKNQKSNEYILFIENDTNSLGYNQWFYFSVQHNQANLKYTFKIVNFKKKHSFFKYGCKPAIFSLHDAKANGQGWSRRGNNISYEQSPIYIQQLANTKFYSLTFDLTFDQKDDHIMIAMNLPYSYTKLIKFLKQIQKVANQDPEETLEFNIKSICTSVCGNDVPQITITKKTEEDEKKKMVIIIARQHPGQIWSSYMAQGMIRRLVEKTDDDINWLLENYIFKIYPMINVDGVIYGNFRCDITGFDLNRRWKDTAKLMHPQIHEIKRRIGLYKSNFKIECCFDLHGHSKQYNIFCYSCKDNQFTCRLLPLIINKLNPVFHFPYCTFGISRYKQSTARATIYRLIRTQNVLTIQNSFYGSKLDGTCKQFGPEDLFKMGSDILSGCRHFLGKKSKLYQNAIKEIQSRINEFTNYDKINEQNSGSESDPSGDQIDLQTKINHIFNKDLPQIQEIVGNKKEPIKKIPIKLKFQQDVLEVSSKQYLDRNLQIMKLSQLNKEIASKIQNKTIDKQTIKKQPLISTSSYIAEKSKKHVSLSQPRAHPKDISVQFNSPNEIVREQRKISVKTIDEPRSERKIIDRRPQIRVRLPQRHQSSLLQQTIDGEQLQKQIQNVRRSNQFIKRFQRFIPISMAIKSKVNATMFEQNLYNEDQSNLISMLLQNKKKIQLQKIKRNSRGREKSRSQIGQRKWSISGHSNRMKKLINRSENQLVSIINDTINEDQF